MRAFWNPSHAGSRKSLLTLLFLIPYSGKKVTYDNSLNQLIFERLKNEKHSIRFEFTQFVGQSKDWLANGLHGNARAAYGSLR
jgi:hypothetical protein